MRRALEYATTFDLPVIQHAEDHALTERREMHEGAISTRSSACAAGPAWPRTSSSPATCCSPSTCGARYHVAHVSTRAAVRILREAKARGIARDRRGDAAPPPAHRRGAARLRHGVQGQPARSREPEDVDALRAALADGTIDCVATDHAPHGSLEKNVRARRSRARDDRPRAVRCRFLLGLVRERHPALWPLSSMRSRPRRRGSSAIRCPRHSGGARRRPHDDRPERDL